MFTGIIEEFATVVDLKKEQSNLHIVLSSSIAAELKPDQSVAHNGVCLTVVENNDKNYRVVAIDETLKKTNLGSLKVGDKINIERCVKMNGRLDGHIVQGHVDTTGICTSISEAQGSWIFHFSYEHNKGKYFTVEKGSITVNGTSLTVVDSTPGAFSVAIIPYTYEHTNFHQIKIGDQVNLEFDILGKYLVKILESQLNGYLAATKSI
jgi:riboflavin synthase